MSKRIRNTAARRDLTFEMSFRRSVSIFSFSCSACSHVGFEPRRRCARPPPNCGTRILTLSLDRPTPVAHRTLIHNPPPICHKSRNPRLSPPPVLKLVRNRRPRRGPTRPSQRNPQHKKLAHGHTGGSPRTGIIHQSHLPRLCRSHYCWSCRTRRASDNQLAFAHEVRPS